VRRVGGGGGGGVFLQQTKYASLLREKEEEGRQLGIWREEGGGGKETDVRTERGGGGGVVLKACPVRGIILLNIVEKGRIKVLLCASNSCFLVCIKLMFCSTRCESKSPSLDHDKSGK
jgi:hypothetical protein